MQTRSRSRDLTGGLAAMAIGAVYAVTSREYPLGTASQMGPGYLPFLLGLLLMLIGAGIVLMSLKTPKAHGPSVDAEAHPPRHALVVLPLAIILFALCITRIGLAPATFLAVLFSTLADRAIGLTRGLLISLVVSGLCVLLFRFALGIQIEMFKWQIF